MDPAFPTPVDVEQDSRFPSGKWIGFWTQTVPTIAKPVQEMYLTFRRGQISGEGHDYLGKFLIRGTYSVDDGKCRWTKSYVGGHDVAYDGFNEGKGIWGTWTIDPFRGGFHIWPEEMGNPSDSELTEEADIPTEVGEPLVVGI